VLVLEMGLEGVDAFEPGAICAEVTAVWPGVAEARQAPHQVVVVRQEADRVTVGFGPIAGKIWIADVELTADQGVAGY
jgi:hypothetical protein